MVHYTYQETIEIAGPDDIGAKTAFVRTFITRDRYDRMRRDARLRFPELTERDSEQLFLRSAFTYSGSEPHALILVGMSGHHPDQEKIVGACRQFLQEELSALGRTGTLQSRANRPGLTPVGVLLDRTNLNPCSATHSRAGSEISDRGRG
jgi:hypothetical protein